MESRRYGGTGISLRQITTRHAVMAAALLVLLGMAALFQPGCGSREISDKKSPVEAQGEPAASQAAPVERSEPESEAVPAPEPREITPAPAQTQSETVPEGAPATEQKPQPEVPPQSEDDPCPS